MAAYLARRRFGHRTGAVAEAFGYSGPSGVSHAVKRIEAAGAAMQRAIVRIEQQLG